jgi:hypothetical protein
MAMSISFLPISAEARVAVASLFEEAPAVLVELRFPGCGTSPDWYLCDDEEQLDKILERVGLGAEIYLSNVQDLKNSKSPVCFRKGSSQG